MTECLVYDVGGAARSFPQYEHAICDHKFHNNDDPSFDTIKS